MQKKGIRLLALVLAMVMMGLSLIGCQSSGTTTGTGDKETVKTEGQQPAEETAGQFDVTLKIMFPGDKPAGQDMVNEAISAKMKEDGLGNFKFEYTFVPWDQYWNKLSMVRAAEEDYDIMWNHVTTITAGVSDYIVAPLNDSLEKYGQNLLEYIPDYAWKQSTFDGKIYAIPRVVPNAQYDWALSIRGDLREKYNLPEIQTLDDLELYFQTIKDNEPGMVPCGYVPFMQAFYREYIPSWFLPSTTAGVYVDLKDPELKVKNFWASDEFAQMCEKSEEFRQKGFYYADYDPQRVTENEFMAGNTASCFGNTMWPTERIDTLKANVPEGEIETVFLNPSEPKYLTTAEDNLLAVFEHSKNVDAAVAFINWVHSSQENYDLFTYGIEGVNWNKNGESASVEGIAPENLYQPISWAWTDLRYHRYSDKLDPSYVDVINHWDDNAVETPLLGFTLDMEPIKQELTNIATVYDTYIKPVVMGGVATFDRDTVISELEKAGIDKVIEEVQRQIDAFVAG